MIIYHKQSNIFGYFAFYLKNKIMYRFLLPFLAAFVFFLTSCDTNAVYDANVPIGHDSWYKDEAAHFEVDIQDTLAAYDFYINLRNTTDYRFSNLYLFMTTKFPNGHYTRDTIECILADNMGKWLGKGWGHLKENEILLNESMRFPMKGKYEFWIQQAMRADTLKGIANIGLRIVKVTE